MDSVIVPKWRDNMKSYRGKKPATYVTLVISLKVFKKKIRLSWQLDLIIYSCFDWFICICLYCFVCRFDRLKVENDLLLKIKRHINYYNNCFNKLNYIYAIVIFIVIILGDSKLLMPMLYKSLEKLRLHIMEARVSLNW